MTQPSEIMSWADEHGEWCAIHEEMVAAGKSPSAFDVSEEQRRRMVARGQRPSTLAEKIASCQAPAASSGGS